VERGSTVPRFVLEESAMKTLTAVVVMSAVASLSLAPAAFAQTDKSTQTPSRSSTDKAREAFKAPDGVLESSKIIGTKVKNSAGKDLAEIEQLLVDTKTGKVTHTVIGKGGVLGVGETKVVVPWTAVNLKADADNRDKLVVTMEQSMLDTAPRYDRRAAGADRPATPAASPRTDEKRTGAPR
jgi:sporulation protein YlmC with PRC-barrel domain